MAPLSVLLTELFQVGGMGSAVSGSGAVSGSAARGAVGGACPLLLSCSSTSLVHASWTRTRHGSSGNMAWIEISVVVLVKTKKIGGVFKKCSFIKNQSGQI
jgi:hypothetical protein